MLISMKSECGREVMVAPSEVDEYTELGYARTDGLVKEAEDPAVIAGRLAYAKALESGKTDEEAKAAQEAAQAKFPETDDSSESEETKDTNADNSDDTGGSDGSEDRG
jgi:hypothetical protein